MFFITSSVIRYTNIRADVLPQYLAVEGDKQKYDLGRAAVEARQCQDLLSQVIDKLSCA